MTDPNVYPPGWDASRVQKVINYYDSMTDDDLAAEISAAGTDANPNDTMMLIPAELVPAVQELLAQHDR